MTSHAKAPSAGTTSGISNRRTLLSLVAGPGSSSGSDGSSAPSAKFPARGRIVAALPVLVATLFLVVGVSQAFALDYTYTNTGSFGSGTGSGDGEFTHPTRIAVESATGNILVADSGNGRIQVFSPSGPSASYLTQFGSGTLSSPYGIAIDQTNGDVYVSDAGNNEIFKFNSDGEPTPAYTVDALFASPSQGSAPGQLGDFAAGIAVDPTNGNLLVADSGNDVVDRYDSDGNFIASFDGSDSPQGAFTDLQDLTVDTSGNVLVLDATGPVYTGGEDPSGAASRALKFDSSGSYVDTIFADDTSGFGMLAFDPHTNQVLAQTTVLKQWIAAYTEDGRFISSASEPSGAHWSTHHGIAVDGGASGRVYVTMDREYCCESPIGVEAFEATRLPVVTIDSPTAITADGAHLSGTVNPEGTDTSWHFEYSKDGSSWTSVGSAQDAGGGEAAVDVSADVTGLAPHTLYKARLVARGSGQTVSTQQEFTTLAIPPLAQPIAADVVTPTSVRLGGLVNPENSQTTYYFEYGTSTSYGTDIPASHDGNAGMAGDWTKVVQDVEGLSPNTTYHYRVVSENSAGAIPSSDYTFNTDDPTAPGPPNRAIELVNSPDKGNQPVGVFTVDTAISPDGNRVVWGIPAGASGTPSGAGASFISDRTATGWQTRNLLPPRTEMSHSGDDPYTFSEYYSYSADFTHFVSLIRETPFASEVPHTVVRLDDQGHQTELHTTPVGYDGDTIESSADLAHEFVRTNEPIDPEHSPGRYHIYDVGSGTPTLVDRLPNGSIPSCGVSVFGIGAGFNDPIRWTSVDGSRIFFLSKGTTCGGSKPDVLYQRDLLTGTTSMVSGPPLSGSQKSASLVRVNEAGTAAIFVTATALTADDTNSDADFYRWHIGEDWECLTCVVPDANVFMPSAQSLGQSGAIASEDLSHVYFVSDRELVPGVGIDGQHNLYVWRDGEIRFVATISVVGGVLLDPDYDKTSATGSSVVFLSSSDKTTAAATDGVRNQYFRYDDSTGDLACVSCPVDGGVPTDGAERNKGPMLTGDGAVFFQTASAVLPADINATDDIYEWRNGQVKLVTDGVTEFAESFRSGQRQSYLRLDGATSDGSSVLFDVPGALVPQVGDHLAQVYVARVGGGFAGQTPPASCSEDSCQGPLQAPPGIEEVGSSSFVGAGNQAARFGRKRHHRKRHHRKHHLRQQARRAASHG